MCTIEPVLTADHSELHAFNLADIVRTRMGQKELCSVSGRVAAEGENKVVFTIASQQLMGSTL